jgi:DNA-binding beta-propeller fold protein YncE
VDGVDNVYVNNGYLDVTIYSAGVYPAVSGPSYITEYIPQSQVFGIATHGQFFAWGSVNAATVQFIDTLLGSPSPYAWAGNADEGLALAFDATGNLYIVNANQTVGFVNFGAGSEAQFANVGFNAAGIAVDSVRGRVYISNQQGNSIAVYSTSGTLLRTIQ